MANPTLQRDSPEHDWVEYLQGLLVARLQSDADAGNVRLSKIDGIFGPITEGSVVYFQSHNGLTDNGVVDDATWAALEGGSASPAGGGSSTTPARNPVDLRLPVRFLMRFDQTTLEQMNQQWLSFDLASAPNAQLNLTGPVGKLIGNGGVQLLNLELRTWPSWYMSWSTKAVLDFAKDKGLQLGTENHAEIGLLPLSGVTLTLEGNAKFMWAPGPAQGSVTWDGGLFLKINLDKVTKKR